MGEEHPAESKVVLEFSPRDLDLDRVQQSKLIKLVGARYDPGKKIVKMSCEMFEHQAQNKRYLSDLVDKLIAEAKVRILEHVNAF
jgi:small subunit ribosomal protein S35